MSAEKMAEAVNAYIDRLSNGTAEEIVDLYAEGATVEDPIGAPIRSSREELIDELNRDLAKEFQRYALQRRMLVNVAGGMTVRLVPPLIISPDSVRLLNDTLASYLGGN